MSSNSGSYKSVEPKILIVEDHDHVRTALRDFLGVSFPGASLVEATNGEEAVSVAKRELPDLVLMDIGLPVLDGIEATRRIKAMSPRIKVVMLTIHESPEYRDDAKEAGADGYVLKRKITSELIPLIEGLLG